MVDEDAERRALEVDVLDRARELLEGTVRDLDLLAALVNVTRLRLFLGLGRVVEDRVDLVLRERDGRLRRAAHESGDLRRVAHEVPGLVGHLHLHEDVAREELPLDVAALPGLHLDDGLLRHADLAEMDLHAEGLDAVLQLRDHTVLEARVRVDDEPVHVRRRRGGGRAARVLRIDFAHRFCLHQFRLQPPKAEKSLFTSGVTAASTRNRKMPTRTV